MCSINIQALNPLKPQMTDHKSAFGCTVSYSHNITRYTLPIALKVKQKGSYIFLLGYQSEECCQRPIVFHVNNEMNL